jgi:6-methylsalicylate decarboxylase
MTVDVHQHLWPEPFLAALSARREPPRLDGWTLHLAGERPYAVDASAHDPERRAEDAEEALICVAASAALGIDRLPPDEAAELAAAWLEGALELPEPFAAWATAGVREPDPEALRDALRRGAVGLEVAADTLAAPGGLDRLAPLLEALEDEGGALLVHPGPAGAADSPDRPRWWAAVVPYVAQLHAAWWAWTDGGRSRHPTLRVCFAALAGLGPLHGERQRARGGAAGRVDPQTFVETSSYGTQAVDAVLRVLGVDVVCHGSDQPYAEPARLALGDAALHAIQTRNPGRLLARTPEEVLP